MDKTVKFLCLILSLLMITGMAQAEEEATEEDLRILEAISAAEDQPGSKAELALVAPEKAVLLPDAVQYTLGPDDVVEITVLRHPEFSGIYPVNKEGKIQYKFVGDIEVTGMTKDDLKDKVIEDISRFVIKPEVNVTITEYKSKIIYVIGEVSRPGKYYMRSDTIPVREAVVEAGLPMLTAAMRKCRLITPDKEGKPKIKYVDLYTILYGGDLSQNINMKPGDVFYVPATVMAKVMRVLRPVTEPVAEAAGAGRVAAGF